MITLVIMIGTWGAVWVGLGVGFTVNGHWSTLLGMGAGFWMWAMLVGLSLIYDRLKPKP